jgi:UDP-3-O-[3-hydroxymyristoyl] glucosamine N-acyltransferase
MMKMTVGQISEMLGAELDGNPEVQIVGPGRIEEGLAGTICFFANPKYEAHVYKSDCAAILVNKSFKLLKPINPALIRVENVYESIGKLLGYYQQGIKPPIDLSSNAKIASSAELGSGTVVGDFTCIGDNVRIGNNCIIHPQVFIANDCIIGDNVKLFPGVKLYSATEIGCNVIVHSNAVIGSDGFGFSQNNEGTYTKIPQTGKVIIEDNVEIGACTTIDRATMGATIIERGVKLDNLIQIGHNAVVGGNTAVAAQTGISGSTKIGKNCLIGGQVGFVGHIKVADGSMFQAKTGVASDITQPDQKYYGYPALSYQNYLKSYAYFRKFPDIVDKIRALEKELDILRNSINND